MRILMVTGEYPAMQGGVGDYTRRLSQALVALGADVHVLTHVDAGGDHLRTPAAPYEPEVHPYLGRTGWQLFPSVLESIRCIRPDVVHIQYQSAAFDLHGAVNYLPMRLRALRNRPRVITTFHDLRYPYLFPKAGPLRWQAVKAIASWSDLDVITNAGDWAVMERSGLAPKLRAIPIGSNIHSEPPAGYDRAATRSLWQASADDWLLGYFGFLNESKGGETLIRTLAELVARGKPARLLMVGGKVGSSDTTNIAYLGRVEALIREKEVGERVQWTGFTPPAQVSANLLAVDCAVLPYVEGATLRHGSLMAALAHGLPVVSTDVATVALEVQTRFPVLRHESSALLVPPNSPAALASAVTRVMEDPSLRQRLADGALALSDQFGWSVIAERHLEVYQEVVEHSPATVDSGE